MKPFWFPAGDSALLLDFQGFKPTKKKLFCKGRGKNLLLQQSKFNLLSFTKFIK